MSNYVIWGSAGHAKVVAEIVRLQGGQVVALFDNRKNASAALADTPLYIGEEGFQQWLALRKRGVTYAATVAIGGVRGRDRIQIQKRLKNAGLRFGQLLHPRAFVASSARIGEGSQVLAHSTVATEVEIGDTCIINHGAVVDHECVLEDGVHIAPGATLCGCIRVGACAFVGAGAVVLPKLTLGDCCVIGAGAVVTKSVPEGAVMVGNPARNIKFQETAQL